MSRTVTKQEAIQEARTLGRRLDITHIVKDRGRDIDLIIGERIVATWTEQKQGLFEQNKSYTVHDEMDEGL